MKQTHIMVDLETWGTTPGSDLRSIGAVVFDPETGALGAEFYVNVDNPRGFFGRYGRFFAKADGRSRKYPLTRDPATVQWWSEQSEAAQQRLTTDVYDLKHGLARFADWWIEQQGGPATREVYATFWANGSHFDFVLLEAAYRAVGSEVPWIYRAPRDCKTIWDAAGGVDLPFEGVEHDALDDAKHQARCVIEAYRRLRP